MADQPRAVTRTEAGLAGGEIPPPAPSSEDAAISASGERRQVLADRYELIGLIGVGGMGSVYRVLDRELSEIVALKMLRRELTDMPGILERFRNEVRLARRVTHVNVARMFDIGEHDGAKFLTMELVDGEPLGSVMARTGPFEIGRALEIAYCVCAALCSAHAAGVVHRDLKPDNVLLTRDGRAVVTDFGIARALLDAGASQTGGGYVGTPAYMAPEQVEGRSDIDARADIYALGLLLYELFTGQRPWTGDTPFMVAAARLTGKPPDPRLKRPDLPDSCARTVLRCLARRREDRFASIEEVANELSLTTLPMGSPESAQRATLRPPLAMGSPSQPPPRAATPEDKTVAVLPFRNAGPREDDYLAEELTDDLIDNLSMTVGLKVRSRGAVIRYRGIERDPREIGRELDVQVVVEGSVRRSHGNVRISARLTSVADGFQLWAKRFERPEQDVLSINDDAASAIAAALTLDRDEGGREAPSNPAAVDLYLRARHEYRQYWAQYQERALELFAQAEALAPGDPMILSGKAMALARRAFFSGAGTADAVEVARQAVAAAPRLAEARLALGAALLQTGDAKGAARELRQAVMRGPGSAEAHGALGRLLAEAGELDEGARYLKNALALDPEVPLAASNLARVHALRGEWALVEGWSEDWNGNARRPLALPMYARFRLWQRDIAGAEAQLAEARAKGEAWGAGYIVLEAALERIRTGRTAPAPASEPSSSRGDTRKPMFRLQLEAEVLACMGAREEALDRLEQSIECGLFDLGWMDRCPLFEDLRKEPRFRRLREIVEQRAQEIVEAARGEV